MKTRSRIADVGLLALPTVVGVLGSIPTIRSVRTWYRTLDRPSWTPSDGAFGPVWTTLYLLMGAALVLVRRTPGAAEADPRVASATRMFGVQLGLNLAWSWIFFGARSIRLAGVEILALWATILATVVAFWRVRPFAAVLLLPYLAWTTLASALNLSIWRRNR